MRPSRIALLSFVAVLLAGCAQLAGPKFPTLIPTEYVPTAIALTVEAGQAAATNTPVANPSLTGASLPTQTATVRNTAAQALTATPVPSSASSPTIIASLTATPRAVVSPSPTLGTLTPAVGAFTPTSETATPAPRTTVNFSPSPTLVESTPTPAFTATIPPTLRFYRTLTATATPGIPSAYIQLYTPGPMSRLSSPIQFSASLQPGASGRVTIELVGENGRILYRKLIRYITQDWVAISESVEFSITAAAETGRLQISTEDEWGRVMALASVDVLLLSMGDDDLNPPTDLYEPLIIREPVVNTLIQGGKVVVTGLARSSGEQLLMIELVDTKGAVVGYRQAAVILPADPWATQGYGTFQAEVPYSVDGPTWVRVKVSAFEDHLPGPTHVSSLVILLGP